MKKLATLFLGLFYVLLSAKAQFGNVKAPEAKLASSLKAKYKDEAGIVALTNNSLYTFELNNSKALQSPVTALEYSTLDMIALKDNYSYEDAIFYNFKSDILEVKARGPKGRRDIGTEYKNYESDGIFYNDAKMCVLHMSFSTRGEKAEYEYKKRYYDVKYLTAAYFHESYPTEEKTITFEVPDWLNVELKEINFEGFNITKTKTANPDKKITTYVYTAKDLHALKSERHAPSHSKNYPHILVLCKNYTLKTGEKKTLLNSVDDLYAWYASLCKEIGNNDETLKPLVERLIAGKKTDTEKIEAIFYWVQENIRYIAFENGIMGFKPEPAQNVYKNKYGDCKGKANLLTQMLKIAGYDARKTWIGTSDIPYDYSIPSLAVDNHMICTVILNGKKYFIDGTEDYIALNDYAHRIQGRPVLIENGDKYILDKVPEFSNERNKLQTTLKMTIDKDVLKGNFKTILNGEGKTNLLRGYAGIRSDKKEEALQKYLSDDNKNLKLSNIKTTDLQERQKPLEINYEFELSNCITHIGNEIYVTIDKDKEFEKFDFDSTRVNDYEFSNKILVETSTDLTIPAGYKVEHLPEIVKKINPYFSFTLSCTTTGNSIHYEKRITIDNALIRKKDFPIWNTYIKDVKNFYNDQIILVKQ